MDYLFFTRRDNKYRGENKMNQWEYCEVDFDGSMTYAWFYDEAGTYIDKPLQHARLGILLAILGHDGWELISTSVQLRGDFRWLVNSRVIYLLKRPATKDWTQVERDQAKQAYQKNNPQDKKY
jgi:hypothetical protein